MIEELTATDLLSPHHNPTQNHANITEICKKQLIEQYHNNISIETVRKR